MLLSQLSAANARALLLQTSTRHVFSKVLYLEALYCKCTRASTFQNVCPRQTPARHAFSKVLYFLYLEALHDKCTRALTFQNVCPRSTLARALLLQTPCSPSENLHTCLFKAHQKTYVQVVCVCERERIRE